MEVMNAVELSGVDLNLLVVLAVLLDEASVTRAAARLGRTQSAVSHALDRLREAFGDPLFVRSGQRMVATPRAESLRAPVADVTARLRDLLLGAPSFHPASAEHRFTITASDYLQVVLIPPLVRRLRERAPGLSLEVHGPKSRLLERLSRGEFDFALAVALPDNTSLYSQKIFTDRFVCLVSADHPAVRRKLDLATYLRLPHALISPLGGTTGYVDRELARAGHSRKVVITIPDFMVAPRVVRGTDLVLTLPERVAHLFENEGLRTLPPPLDLPDLSGHLVWHERVSRDAPSLWFRQQVEQVCRELPGPRPEKGKSIAAKSP